jgi:transposase
MAQRRRKPAAKPKRIGRPSKLTKKVEEALAAALRAGNYVDTACEYAGISRATFYRWLEQAEKPGATNAFRDFRDAIKKASADAEVYAVGVVKQAMPANWQAAMTFLERRYPEKWRRRDRQEVTGRDGGPVRMVTELEFADPAVREAGLQLVDTVAAAREARAKKPLDEPGVRKASHQLLKARVEAGEPEEQG